MAGIERELYGRGEPEVSSTDIGELVMAGLPKLNEVAYVRFASVYRKFRDISSFERELSKIRESKELAKPKKKSLNNQQFVAISAFNGLSLNTPTGAS